MLTRLLLSAARACAGAPARAAALAAVVAAAPAASAGAQSVATTASGRDGAPSAAAARVEVGAGAGAAAASARRTARAPVIDGRPDDAAWAEAVVIDQFLEYEPTPGATPRFRTEARVVYDDRAMFVQVRMHDPAPDSILTLLSRRDVRTQSDQVKIVVDAYHDGRTAYQFALNPAGVKRDYYVYNDVDEDPTWDGVWDGAARVDSLGWVAEFRIPFSQLRFANRPSHTFGLLIVRDVARTGQRISWPLYRRDRQGYVSQAGALAGIDGLAPPRRIEVAPYVVTKNVTQARTGGASGFRHPQQTSLGADAKIGLASNLTLDATINPDFGQVEADPAVLNLSAFEQFFEERRPFFLEGAGTFAYRTACDDIDTGCTGLFYSRRIGRAPQLSGRYGDAASPTFSTIQGAAKLTGRTPRGLSVGVLDAVTQRERGVDGADGFAGPTTVEPATNYFVARATQDLRGGQSGVGAMLTAVNRALDPSTDRFLRRSAYTGGLDLRHRFGGTKTSRNYELTASLSGSVVGGSQQAIAALQRDGVHRYQRPDDAVSLDTTRTRLVGDAQRLTISKFGGGITRFQSVYQRFSPGFETNDLGFQTRADEQLFRNWFAFQIQKPTRLFRQAYFNFNEWNSWTTAGLRTNIGVNTNWHVQLPSQHWVHLGGTANAIGASFDDRAARGGPAVRLSPRWNLFTGWEGDARWAASPNVFAGRFGSDEGRSGGWWVGPGVELRMLSQLSASLSANYERNVNDWQWVGNVGDAGVDTTRYTFARLNQTTLSVTTRFNFTATPTLSLQLWAQPFLTTGSYSNLRALANPRAERYADRFAPYAGDPGGFDVAQLRANSVLRWEYRPGSTLFLVWQHGRQGYDGRATSFDFGRDYADLWRLPPQNTFLIKMSYWINPKGRTRSTPGPRARRAPRRAGRGACAGGAQGVMRTGVPTGRAAQSSSTASSVRATQPNVQSRARWAAPTRPWPLGRPWIITSPPGLTPSARARARSAALGYERRSARW